MARPTAPSSPVANAHANPCAADAALLLYLRDDCALCDRALAVLAAARTPAPRCVVIDDDPALEARYGTRIPVLARADGAELDWPFDAASVRAWCGSA